MEPILIVVMAVASIGLFLLGTGTMIQSYIDWQNYKDEKEEATKLKPWTEKTSMGVNSSKNPNGSDDSPRDLHL